MLQIQCCRDKTEISVCVSVPEGPRKSEFTGTVLRSKAFGASERTPLAGLSGDLSSPGKAGPPGRLRNIRKAVCTHSMGKLNVLSTIV